MKYRVTFDTPSIAGINDIVDEENLMARLAQFNEIEHVTVREVTIIED